MEPLNSSQGRVPRKKKSLERGFHGNVVGHGLKFRGLSFIHLSLYIYFSTQSIVLGKYGRWSAWYGTLDLTLGAQIIMKQAAPSVIARYIPCSPAALIVLFGFKAYLARIRHNCQYS